MAARSLVEEELHARLLKLEEARGQDRTAGEVGTLSARVKTVEGQVTALSARLDTIEADRTPASKTTTATKK